MILTRLLTHTATYWPPGKPDGFGGVEFGTPMLVQPGVRWEDTREIMRSAEGEEFVSTAQVFVPFVVEEKGYLAQGDQTPHANPKDAPGAFEIRKVSRVRNLRDTKETVTAWL